jgi:hypothetical protein
MGTLLMSQKERRRLVVLEQVKSRRLSLVKAAEVMRVSYRQAKRIWCRYQEDGDAGLVHQSRGRPGRRRKPEALRAKVLARYAQRYPDFGPTLAAEKLQEEGLAVDHETLRRWLLVGGQWSVRRRRQKHRQWRERRACFGDMVQMDGSEHDWFEGRGQRPVLMVMIDDATNQTYAQFFEGETTRACFDMIEQWARRHGLPQSLYVDRDSIYRCERLPSVEEQLGGKAPQTQFGRAMQQLGVEVILANSPQAKGRVERRNGLLQDRLVKELRLAGISDVARANAFLRQKFLPQINRRFTVKPTSQADVHRPLVRDMDAILSWEYERVVQRDWTVACQGRCYQIEKEHEGLSLVGRRVRVRQRRSGQVELLYAEQVLRMKALPAKPVRTKEPPRRIGRLAVAKPMGDHPWKTFGAATGKPFWRERKAAGRAARLSARDSGRPPLRSGLPPSLAERRNTSSNTTQKGDIFS